MSDGNRNATGQAYRRPDWLAGRAIVRRAERLRSEWLARSLAGLAGYVRDQWIEPLRRARRRSADLAMLMHLDDSTLDDIGLSRADLLAARYHGAPLGRPVARRHESEDATVVPLSPPRAPAASARDLDAAA